ncbi:uncharacterized protein [Temnothorax longispinosus]|uniref:uncharacterized protein n=1 Tax=Temnothorax longispinosus TaxID=300112 RepID=UPI003A9983EA
MVRKCCVPKCSSNKDTPVHRLPRDTQKAEQWLRTIGRTDLIGASETILKELRICTLHFPDHMICVDTKRRVLKNDAIPSMHLSDEIETVNINININSDNNDIMSCNASTSQINETVENVQCNPNSISLNCKDKRVVELQRNVRRMKKSIYKKKKIIEKQRREKKNLQRNKWKDMTTDLTKYQKIFFDMIEKNLKLASGVTDFKIKDTWKNVERNRIVKFQT